MTTTMTRRLFLGQLAAAACWLAAAAGAPAKSGRSEAGGGRKNQSGAGYELPAALAEFARWSLVLGRVTDRAATVSAQSAEPAEVFFEYGVAAGGDALRTGMFALAPAEPAEAVLDRLQPDAEYSYRLQVRRPGAGEFRPGPEGRFHTQRAAGRTFSFGVQGDSHPERPQMSDPELYARTLLHAAAARPDFYVCMGDDFSVAPVRTVDASSVEARYALQRPFLGIVGRSAPLFLVNGNHEQASRFNFDQTDERHALAVLAQNARARHFPQPAPDGFYSGDAAPLPGIGPLRDYCAWTWGDALFVVLDNYWHSPALVDTGFRKEETDKRARDGWELTLGEAQYRWLERTLAQSRARHKFVFAHHVLGTGRGGTDACDLYEWGGRSRRGDWEFDRRRPGWALPVHRLMVKHGVSVFFQGHDHLYASQECDGLVYQTVPLPADPGYVAYNQDSFRTGVKLPNSGYLRVTVAPDEVSVEYVRCYLPQDETSSRRTGEVAHRYAVKARPGHV